MQFLTVTGPVRDRAKLFQRVERLKKNGAKITPYKVVNKNDLSTESFRWLFLSKCILLILFDSLKLWHVTSRRFSDKQWAMMCRCDNLKVFKRDVHSNAMQRSLPKGWSNLQLNPMIFKVSDPQPQNMWGIIYIGYYLF